MRLWADRRELRCVLFHDVSDQPTPFTRGLGITMGTAEFEARIRYLARHYTPVSFAELREGNGRARWPRPPVLVTFDDAYASVAENAAPVCRKYGVPALFFVNASCLDNAALALDNAVCYAANTAGLEVVNAVARRFRPGGAGYSLAQVFGEFLPALPLRQRQAFQEALAGAAGIDAPGLGRQAKIYLTGEQLRHLAASGFEIGDHTYSHVHLRALAVDELGQEIDGNRAALERATGQKVRVFSVPYGSSADYTPAVAEHLRQRGYEAAFLVESLPNRYPLDFQRLYRVSVHSRSDLDFWADLEVRPYLRVVRNRYFRRPMNGRVMA